jgi:hypothetical protein
MIFTVKKNEVKRLYTSKELAKELGVSYKYFKLLAHKEKLDKGYKRYKLCNLVLYYWDG